MLHGRSSLEILRAMLPASTVILAIDEHTACVLDLGTAQARVHGTGSVRVLRDAECHTLASDETFPISLLRK